MDLLVQPHLSSPVPCDELVVVEVVKAVFVLKEMLRTERRDLVNAQPFGFDAARWASGRLLPPTMHSYVPGTVFILLLHTVVSHIGFKCSLFFGVSLSRRILQFQYKLHCLFYLLQNSVVRRTFVATELVLVSL